MSLFCPGISWGRRRRALTRGASRRRRKVTVSRGISTSDVSSSTSDDVIGDDVLCGCGSRRKDKHQISDKRNTDYGGVFMGQGQDHNNNPSPPGMQSILYFDESLPPGQSADNSRAYTPYQPTPEPKSCPAAAACQSQTSNLSSSSDPEHQEKPGKIFIPTWIRHRRYLPTIDDVDFDNIDAISFHSSGAATPAQLKALVRDSPKLSPIYENLVDKELSDIYLQAQMSAIFYSSTPAPVSLVNVAPPQVMTATSEAAPCGDHRKSRTPLKQLSFNTSTQRISSPNKGSPKKRSNFLSPKQDKTRKQTDASVIDKNQNVNDAKENNFGSSPRTTSGKKRPKRRSEGITRRRSDLLKTTLKRNLSYQPIREQDIDDVFTDCNEPPLPLQHSRVIRQPAAAASSTPSASSSHVLGDQNWNIPISPFPITPVVKEFRKLSVDQQSATCNMKPSSETLSSIDTELQVPARIDSETVVTPVITPRIESIIHEPKFADNSVRKARIVSISPSPSDSSLTSPDAMLNTDQPTPAHTIKSSKLGTSWSFVCSGPNKHALHFAEPLEHKSIATPSRQTKSETNIRSVEARLSQHPKQKIQEFDLVDDKQRQVDHVPEHEKCESRDVDVTSSRSSTEPESSISHNSTPSVTPRKISFSKDPCGEGVILFDFIQHSEGDASLKRGDCVTILNTDDKEWLYVKLDSDPQKEGFVPRSYVFINPQRGPPTPQSPCHISPNDIQIRQSRKSLPTSQIREVTTNKSNTLPRKNIRQRGNLVANEVKVNKQRRNMRKGPNDRYLTLVETYVVVRDHIAQEIDECNVSVGELVFVNSKQQRDDQLQWMWVLVPGTGNMGYIPAFSARPVDFQSSNV